MQTNPSATSSKASLTKPTTVKKDDNSNSSEICTQFHSTFSSPFAACTHCGHLKPSHSQSSSSSEGDVITSISSPVNSEPAISSISKSSWQDKAELKYSSSSGSNIDPRYVEELENDFFDLEDKYAALVKTKQVLIEELEGKIGLLEEANQFVKQYHHQNQKLTEKCNNLERKVDFWQKCSSQKRDSSPNDSSPVPCSTPISPNIEDEDHPPDDVLVKSVKVKEVESSGLSRDHVTKESGADLHDVCTKLTEENEMLKEEIDDLQREVEEMYDHYQEEDTDSLREVQSQLESANKNIRVIQFRLRKAEHRFEQSETERLALEQQLLTLASKGGVTEGNESSESPSQIVGDLESASLAQLKLALLRSRERERELTNQLCIAEEDLTDLQNRLAKYDETNYSNISSVPIHIPTAGDSTKSPIGMLTDENQRLHKKAILLEKAYEALNVDLNSYRAAQRDAPPAVSSTASIYASLASRQTKKHFLSQPRISFKQDQFAFQKSHSLDTTLESFEKQQNLQSIRDHLNDDDSCTVTNEQEEYFKEKLKHSHLEISRLERENQRLLTLTKSNFRSNKQLADFELRLKRLAREVRLKASVVDPSGTSKRERELFDKYNDSVLIRRKLEAQLNELKNRIVQLEMEKVDLTPQPDLLPANSQETKRNAAEANNGSSEALWQEIKDLENEVVDLSKDLDATKKKLSTLTVENQRKDGIIEEMKSDFTHREKEMTDYCADIENKNTLLSNLLQIVEDRANELQSEFDRLVADDGVDNSRSSVMKEKNNTMNESRTSNSSAISSVSAGSDDVFSEQASKSIISFEKLNSRLRCLERLLAEERQRTRVAEKQLEHAMKESPRSRVNQDTQLILKEVDILKKELEEKEDHIEDQDRQIIDFRQRLEQSRKMQESVKMLTEQDEAKTPTSPNSFNELNSKNLNEMKSEVNHLRQKSEEYESGIQKKSEENNRLSQEIHHLKEELQIREESIFEQDNEIDQCKKQIRELNRLLTDEQEEQVQLRNDLHLKSEEVEQMRTELGKRQPVVTLPDNPEERIHELTLEISQLEERLTEMLNQIDEKDDLLEREEEKCKQISDAMRLRDDRLKEKDDVLIHLNKRISEKEGEMRKANEQLAALKDQLDQRELEVKQLKLEMANLEREVRSLTNRMEADKTANEQGRLKELEATKMEISGLKGELDSREKEIRSLKDELKRVKSTLANAITSGNRSSRMGGVSTTGVSVREVEKLKKEIDLLKKERYEREKTWKEEKKQFEMKWSKEFEQKDKGGGNPVKLACRIKLLSDYISKLNSNQIDLKLQNESLHRDIIDLQRKYRNLKHNFENEQNRWCRDKAILETRAKDQEDRKVIIVNLRKSLQESALKVAELESVVTTQKLEFDMAKYQLEADKDELQKRVLSFEEEKMKGPKMFHRFSKNRNSHTTDKTDRESSELKRKLQEQDAAVKHLRNEIIDREQNWSVEKQELLKRNGGHRLKLEKEIEQMRLELMELENQRNLAACYREKLETFEDSLERERRQVNEERLALRHFAEESYLALESWVTKLKDTLAEYENSEEEAASDKAVLTDDLINFIESVKNLTEEMDKYTQAKDKIPYSHLKKKWLGDSSTNTPIQGNSRFSSLLSIGPRTGSMEWTNRIAAFRVNRSVSPDVSVRKVTAYPDPTPGFLFHSRQNSNDSLSSLSNLQHLDESTSASSSARIFRPTPPTIVPGVAAHHESKSRSSPARQKFFADYMAAANRAELSSGTCPQSNSNMKPNKERSSSDNVDTVSQRSSSTSTTNRPRSILSTSQGNLSNSEKRRSKTITFDNDVALDDPSQLISATSDIETSNSSSV